MLKLPPAHKLQTISRILDFPHPIIESFEYQGWHVCNFEMESSALYGLGKMLGHNCLTVCVAIANRVTEKFASDYHPYVKKLILNTLERLSAKE